MDLSIILWLVFSVIALIFYHCKNKEFPKKFSWIEIFVIGGAFFGGLYFMIWSIDTTLIGQYVPLPISLNIIAFIGGLSILILAWEELMKITKTEKDTE